VAEDSFTVLATSAGRLLVRIHYTPYWRVVSGEGAVSEAAGGWTYVTCSRAGRLTVKASFSLIA
jgi:hypothetical protein